MRQRLGDDLRSDTRRVAWRQGEASGLSARADTASQMTCSRPVVVSPNHGVVSASCPSPSNSASAMKACPMETSSGAKSRQKTAADCAVQIMPGVDSQTDFTSLLAQHR